jgi:multidrug efflux pump subunit AcrA (membrane-fusion protein)
MNRTLRTEIDLPNADAVLRPGMYASAEIVLQERPNVLALPLSAIVTVDKQTYCFAVTGNKIVRKPINLGLKTREEVEVTDGLAADELVVQSQVSSLRDGQLAEIAKP